MSRAPKPAKSAPLKSQPAHAAPAWLKFAVACLAVFLLLTWFTKEVADSDTWWHLKTGQYILQTHKLPVPDPFAFTTALSKFSYPGEDVVRHFNLTHEWLAQIVFYLIYAAGGFPLLVLFRSAMLILVSAIVAHIVFRRTGGFYRAIVAAVATGSIGLAYLSDRPFLFTFVFLAAVIAICDERRRLWLMPPMFLIWSNLHGGYFIGWTALAAYCADALYSRFRGRPDPTDRTLFLASAVSVLASGINPNGFNAIRVAMLYRQSVVQNRLLEWQHTNPFELQPFQVLLILTFLTLILCQFFNASRARTGESRVRVSDWLFFFGYGVFALWAVRNVMFFGIAAPILLATYFPWTKLRPVAEYAFAIALAALSVYQISGGHAFELRASTWKYPWGAAKFLEEHHVTNRLFNSYPNGGFLIWRLWPQEKVFIDGRAMGDDIFKDFIRIATYASDDARYSPREMVDMLLKRYGVETVLLEGFEYNSGDPYVAVAAMSDPRQNDWTLVFQDDTAAVFMRHPPPGIPAVQLPYPLAGMEMECRNYIEHDPTRVRCARGLGLLFLRLGDAPHARQWLAFYLDHAPPDPESQQAYSRILAGGR